MVCRLCTCTLCMYVDFVRNNSRTADERQNKTSSLSFFVSFRVVSTFFIIISFTRIEAILGRLFSPHHQVLIIKSHNNNDSIYLIDYIKFHQ